MKKLLSAFVVLAMAVGILSGCNAKSTSTSSASTEEPGNADIKVVLLGGKLGGTSFTDEVYQGLVDAKAAFGITTEHVEVTETADYETQGRYLAATGEYDLIIIGTSTASEILKMMAPDYPDQKFSIVDTKVEGVDNVHSVGAKDPEQAFLSGVISGIITKGTYKEAFPMTNDSNVLCYVGGMDNPISRSGAAGFIAGAKYVNPEVEVLYTIVGGYTDPAGAKEIALRGIERGADVVTGNCGAGIKGILEACKQKGTYYIATSPADNDVNQSLCLSAKRSDLFVYNEIESIVNDTWKAGYTSLGIAEGVCNVSFEGLAIKDKYPKEILDIVDAIREEVKSGALKLPYDVSDIDTWSASNQYKW